MFPMTMVPSAGQNLVHRLAWEGKTEDFKKRKISNIIFLDQKFENLNTVEICYRDFAYTGEILVKMQKF